MKEKKLNIASPKRSCVSILISVVTVICLLTTIVYAAESTPHSGNWFNQFLGKAPSETEVVLTQNQQAILDQGVVHFDQSMTHNGYTITLESGISDGRRALFTFRVDAPDGVVFKANQYGLLLETNMKLPDSSEGNYGLGYCGGSILEDDNPNDNSILFLKEYCVQLPIDAEYSTAEGNTWSFHITGIQEYGVSANVLIAEGSWDFTVKFSDNSMVTKFVELLEQPVKCSAKRYLRDWKFNIQAKVTSFQLGTLSATVLYNRPFAGFWDGVMLDNPIYLVMNDGSKVQATFRMSVNRKRYEECMYVFDRPVSFADVAYVEFPHT